MAERKKFALTIVKEGGVISNYPSVIDFQIFNQSLGYEKNFEFLDPEPQITFGNSSVSNGSKPGFERAPLSLHLCDDKVLITETVRSP